MGQPFRGRWWWNSRAVRETCATMRGMYAMPPDLNGPLGYTHGHGGHEVHSVADYLGEPLAYLCATCDEQLPLNYDCGDCDWIEVTRLCDADPTYIAGRTCSRHGGSVFA
jgi:hypothetical protein